MIMIIIVVVIIITIHSFIYFESNNMAGADPRGGDDRPPRRLLAKKIETPGRSKVGFSSPRMHQNSPFWAQKSKNFWKNQLKSH